MATAEKITDFYPPYYLQSSVVAETVFVQAAKEERSGGKKTHKELLTTQAPGLKTAPQAKAPTNQGYLQALAEYMTGMLDAGVKLAQDQTRLGQTETNAANASAKMAQAQADQIKEKWKEYDAEMEKMKHASFWTKIGMSIAGALMAAIGAVTLNPEIVLMGALTIGMANGGSQALNSALGLNNLPLGLKILAEVGIAAVLAGVTCGMSGVSSALSTGTEATVEAASEAAANAGAEAAEEAADGAASSVAENENQSFGSQVFEKGFMGGRFRGANFVSNMAAMSMLANPFTDLTVAAIRGLRAAGVRISENAEELSSQIVGAVLGILVTLGTSLCSSAGEQLGGAKLAQAVGEKNMSRVVTTLRTLTKLAMGGAGVGGIFTGKALLEQADTLRELGNAQNTLALAQGLQSFLSQTIASTQTITNTIGQAYADINSRWGSFVAGYATAAEILG
jgi:hypothetical protein